jgi:hypothetical protein
VSDGHEEKRDERDPKGHEDRLGNVVEDERKQKPNPKLRYNEVFRPHLAGHAISVKQPLPHRPVTSHQDADEQEKAHPSQVQVRLDISVMSLVRPKHGKQRPHLVQAIA